MLLRGPLHGAPLTAMIGDQQSAMVGQRCFTVRRSSEHRPRSPHHSHMPAALTRLSRSRRRADKRRSRMVQGRLCWLIRVRPLCRRSTVCSRPRCTDSDRMRRRCTSLVALRLTTLSRAFPCRFRRLSRAFPTPSPTFSRRLTPSPTFSRVRTPHIHHLFSLFPPSV